jgi:hypothetical protein
MNAFYFIFSVLLFPYTLPCPIRIREAKTLLYFLFAKLLSDWLLAVFFLTQQ